VVVIDLVRGLAILLFSLARNERVFDTSLAEYVVASVLEKSVWLKVDVAEGFTLWSM